jgi:pimeloyl-ACP methyl ester carboxylesterase
VVLRLLAEHPDRAISGALIGMGWHRPHSAELHELRSNRGPAAEALVASLPQLDISEADLAAIQVPFAVWVGARDPVRKDQVIELSRVRPDVPVHVIQKVGHSQILRNGRFQDALADFIDGGYAELAEGR